jgi:hypothetical protein
MIELERLKEIMRSCFSDATRRAMFPAFMVAQLPEGVTPDSVLESVIGVFAAYIQRELFVQDRAFLDRMNRAEISISFICAECGDFAYGPKACLSLDSGTTFTCEKCGKKTVVDLWKTCERKEFYTQREDLAMLVRKLAHRLPKDDEWAKKAMGYLVRKGLQGSVLREVDMNDYDLELEASSETACGRAGRKHRMKRISSGRCQCIYPDCDAFYEG